MSNATLESTDAIAESLSGLPLFLTDVQLAGTGLVALQTLRNWRVSKLGGPEFVRAGRVVKYPKAAVIRWLEQRKVTPSRDGID